VLAAYGGGLGNRLGLAEIALLAITTWALLVLLAVWMSRRGHRGPAEVLLRRLLTTLLAWRASAGGARRGASPCLARPSGGKPAP
jgi:uncharacterized membrane protein YeiB